MQFINISFRMAANYSMPTAVEPIDASAELLALATAEAQLLADGVRLAVELNEIESASALAGHASAQATGPDIPHRRANAKYCRGLLDGDAGRLLEAAARYAVAGRPLLRAKALEAAAGNFVSTDDRDQARAALTRAFDIYTSLGAAADVARLQATFRAHGIRQGPNETSGLRSGSEGLTPTETKIAAPAQVWVVQTRDRVQRERSGGSSQPMCPKF